MTQLPIRLDYAVTIQHDLKRLRRKYRQIEADIRAFGERLKSGETPGDHVQEVIPFVVYKARVKNSDVRKGKSGGSITRAGY